MTADIEKARFVALLDRAALEGRPIQFWWRDDDAVDVTPALNALLTIQARQAVPLALAVIPKAARPALARHLADHPDVTVFQHGWQHQNHRDKARNERASEFPRSRPVERMRRDLQLGSTRLRDLFADRFLPVLTPPWNRISTVARRLRAEVGLTGLSAFGPVRPDDGPTVRHCHVDVIRWRGQAAFAGRLKCYRRLTAQTRRRLAGVDQPIGLLTHHLVHDDATNAFVDEIVALTAGHPGAAWPPLRPLFGLEQNG